MKTSDDTISAWSWIQELRNVIERGMMDEKGTMKIEANERRQGWNLSALVNDRRWRRLGTA